MKIHMGHNSIFYGTDKAFLHRETGNFSPQVNDPPLDCIEIVAA